MLSGYGMLKNLLERLLSLDTDKEDSINQKQRRNDESDTVDMYDNDRYTDDFTDREVKDSVYL